MRREKKKIVQHVVYGSHETSDTVVLYVIIVSTHRNTIHTHINQGISFGP